MHEIANTHNLFIVKHNNGRTVRLAEFLDLLFDRPQAERLEIEITDLTKEEANNESWKQHKMIWFNPTNPVWYEATQDDAKAKAEYKLVVEKLKHFPDIIPEIGIPGILIRIESGKHFRVVEGNFRRQIESRNKEN